MYGCQPKLYTSGHVWRDEIIKVGLHEGIILKKIQIIIIISLVMHNYFKRNHFQFLFVQYSIHEVQYT